LSSVSIGHDGWRRSRSEARPLDPLGRSRSDGDGARDFNQHKGRLRSAETEPVVADGDHARRTRLDHPDLTTRTNPHFVQPQNKVRLPINPNDDRGRSGV
jgi:hypothetical protein